MRLIAFALAFALGLAAARGDEARDSFIQSNIISTLYQEFGHALVDVLKLPVLGREEDAADALATLLIHQLWEEDAAVTIVYDTAYAYSLAHDEAEREGDGPVYHGQHGTDLQRYYMLVCHFYGANPDERAEVARELELPEERMEDCPDEWELMASSWGKALDAIEKKSGKNGKLVLVPGKGGEPARSLVAAEIKDLNALFSLPVTVQVRIEECGEANAFYYPGDKAIVVCTEYAEDLGRMWDEAPDETQDETAGTGE